MGYQNEVSEGRRGNCDGLFRLGRHKARRYAIQSEEDFPIKLRIVIVLSSEQCLPERTCHRLAPSESRLHSHPCPGHARLIRALDQKRNSVEGCGRQLIKWSEATERTISIAEEVPLSKYTMGRLKINWRQSNSLIFADTFQDQVKSILECGPRKFLAVPRKNLQPRGTAERAGVRRNPTEIGKNFLRGTGTSIKSN